MTWTRAKTRWLMLSLLFFLLGLLLLVFGPMLTPYPRTFSWVDSVRAGRAHFERSDYLPAEWYLMRALRQAERFGLEDRRRAHTLRDLAELYEEQGRTVEAASLLEQAIPILEKAGDSKILLATCLQLSQLYQDQGRFPEVLAMLQQACELTRTLKGPDDPLVAHLLVGTLVPYKEMGRFEEAEAAIEQAAEILRRVPGPPHPRLADALHFLAETRRWQGKYAQAEEGYREELGIREQDVQPDKEYSAKSLHRL